MDVSIEVKEDTDEVRVHVGGRLDRQALELFQESMGELDLAGRRLVLDITKMAELDSCGLGMLLLAREMAQASAVLIRGAPPEIRHKLEIVNFGSLFEIE